MHFVASLFNPFLSLASAEPFKRQEIRYLHPVKLARLENARGRFFSGFFLWWEFRNVYFACKDFDISSLVNYEMVIPRKCV